MIAVIVDPDAARSIVSTVAFLEERAGRRSDRSGFETLVLGTNWADLTVRFGSRGNLAAGPEFLVRLTFRFRVVICFTLHQRQHQLLPPPQAHRTGRAGETGV